APDGTAASPGRGGGVPASGGDGGAQGPGGHAAGQGTGGQAVAHGGGQAGSGGREREGVTAPSQRGSSNRFLTDVIADMGFVSRRQVDEAIESSRSAGTTPEKML